VLIIASLFAAVIPMSIYLLIIWKMDKYEPEPLKFVLYHFLWGAFGAIIFALLLSSIAAVTLEASIGIAHPLVMTILIAPLMEEITKGVYLTKTYRDKRFDNITDGLVYGAAIGLGFGMTENFFYFIAYGDTFSEWIGTVIIRSGFSAVMHCIASGTLGAILGFIKFSTVKNKTMLTFLGILLAMAVHSFWNASVSFENTFVFGFLFMFILIMFFILVYMFSLKSEVKLLRLELANELPEKYIKILCSKKRFESGWIEENIRRRFLKTTTRLAFRKRQYMRYNDQSLLKEIESLRQELIVLLPSEETNEDK
jgi:RsiW-degrading membrane proteinase PrsW (M82 family)